MPHYEKISSQLVYPNEALAQQVRIDAAKNLVASAEKFSSLVREKSGRSMIEQNASDGSEALFTSVWNSGGSSLTFPGDLGFGAEPIFHLVSVFAATLLV